MFYYRYSITSINTSHYFLVNTKYFKELHHTNNMSNQWLNEFYRYGHAEKSAVPMCSFTSFQCRQWSLWVPLFFFFIIKYMTNLGCMVYIFSITYDQTLFLNLTHRDPIKFLILRSQQCWQQYYVLFHNRTRSPLISNTRLSTPPSNNVPLIKLQYFTAPRGARPIGDDRSAETIRGF